MSSPITILSFRPFVTGKEMGGGEYVRERERWVEENM